MAELGFDSARHGGTLNSICPAIHGSLHRQAVWYAMSQGGDWDQVLWEMCVLSLTRCKSMDSNLPGSSVHRISQARILEQVAISSAKGSSQSRDRTRGVPSQGSRRRQGGAYG